MKIKMEGIFQKKMGEIALIGGKIKWLKEHRNLSKKRTLSSEGLYKVNDADIPR